MRVVASVCNSDVCWSRMAELIVLRITLLFVAVVADDVEAPGQSRIAEADLALAVLAFPFRIHVECAVIKFWGVFHSCS